MRRREAGQATIETMLLAFVGVVFMAAAFQLYLVNRSVNRTLSQVHSRMLQSMYDYNHDGEKYDRETVKVIWGENHNFTQLRPQTLGMFKSQLDDDDFLIHSHWVEQHGDPDASCDYASPPCKRTKAGGGLNAGDPWTVAGNSLSSLGDGDYGGWLGHNMGNAVGDIAGIRDMLTEMQQGAQAFQGVAECIDDLEACAFECFNPFGGECPL
jgi:hypothetical protein